MKSFIILVIVAPLSFVVLGILVTLLKSKNLKLKIVLAMILRSVVFTVLVSLLTPTLFDGSWLWTSVFAFAFLLMNILFNKEKFLETVIIHDNTFSVTYVNGYLQKKTITVDNTAIIQLSDMKSIIDYPGSLRIGDGDNLQRFIIFNKEIWNVAKASIGSAGDDGITQIKHGTA